MKNSFGRNLYALGLGTVGRDMVYSLVSMYLMFYLTDIASGVTNAYMLIAGVVLVGLTLFAPQGIAGEVRRRLWRWLP